jgi:hypothetical protein
MEKQKRLSMRMTDEEKALLSRLSQEYGFGGNVSDFLRMVLTYIDTARPSLTIKFVPKKALAPRISVN